MLMVTPQTSLHPAAAATASAPAPGSASAPATAPGSAAASAPTTAAPRGAHAPVIGIIPPNLEGKAGDVQTTFGRWFEQLGAIGGGQAVAAHTLLLRFTSNSDALLAKAALSPVVDGVRILVRNQNGSVPVGDAPAAGAVADFVARISDLTSVQARTTPDHAFVVTSPVPDINAQLDWILRRSIAGMPVRWATSGEAAPRA